MISLAYHIAKTLYDTTKALAWLQDRVIALHNRISLNIITATQGGAVSSNRTHEIHTYICMYLCDHLANIIYAYMPHKKDFS